MSSRVEFYRKHLVDRVWHTTSPDRFAQIVANGAILPHPDLPDSQRWKTSRGPDFYPYVRKLEGVSLFDFRDVDIESYSEKFPLSSWAEFVPFQSCFGAAVWILIDVESLDQTLLLNPAKVVDEWKRNEAYKHTIMPEIEAAFLGPISTEFFKGAFRVGSEFLPEEIALI